MLFLMQSTCEEKDAGDVFLDTSKIEKIVLAKKRDDDMIFFQIQATTMTDKAFEHHPTLEVARSRLADLLYASGVAIEDAKHMADTIKVMDKTKS